MGMISSELVRSHSPIHSRMQHRTAMRGSTEKRKVEWVGRGACKYSDLTVNLAAASLVY